MKNQLGGKVMIKFLGLRAKIYSYLIDDKYKKTKGTKKCVIKKQPKFEDYRNCLKATERNNKINHLEKIKLM